MIADIPSQYQWILDEPIEDILAACPPAVAELIELVGLDCALLILVRFSGEQLYVPKLDGGAFRRLRDRRICRESDGTNARQLARKYNLSMVAVYEIIARGANGQS